MRSALSLPLLTLPLTLAIACAASGGGGDAGDGDGDGDSPGVGGSVGDGDAGDGDMPGDGDAPGTGGAGSGGAGSGGSGTGGGTPGSGGSTPAGVLFSDNFDSATAGAVTSGSTWSKFPAEDASSVVAIVTDKARSAPHSVYVVNGDWNTAFLQLVDSSVFPFAGDKIHVRAYINLPDWPASGHTSWMEVGSTTNDADEMRVGANQGVLEVNHYKNGGDEETIAPGVTLTPDIWHCLEYAYDQAAISLEVWLDGTKVEALTVTNGVFGNSAQSVTPPPIDQVRFGAEIAATEAWFDDIVVGTAYIGCD